LYKVGMRRAMEIMTDESWTKGFCELRQSIDARSVLCALAAQPFRCPRSGSVETTVVVLPR
jgi:hypothetical protein